MIIYKQDINLHAYSGIYGYVKEKMMITNQENEKGKYIFQ